MEETGIDPSVDISGMEHGMEEMILDVNRKIEKVKIGKKKRKRPVEVVVGNSEQAIGQKDSSIMEFPKQNVKIRNRKFDCFANATVQAVMASPIVEKWVLDPDLNMQEGSNEDKQKDEALKAELMPFMLRQRIEDGNTEPMGTAELIQVCE